MPAFCSACSASKLENCLIIMKLVRLIAGNNWTALVLNAGWKAGDIAGNVG